MHRERAYQRIQLGFAAAAICIGFFVVITYLNMQHSVKQSQNVRTSQQNLLYFENLLIEIQAMETGQRGYILTGDEAYLVSHNRGLKNIENNIGRLTSVSSYDPVQKEERNALAHLIDQKVAHSTSAVAIRKRAGYDSAAAYIRSGNGENLMQRIRAGIRSQEEIDRKLLKEANAESVKAATTTAWLFICLAIAFYIILYLNYRTIINDFRRRKISEEKLTYNASLINSISDPVITTDGEFRITKWNKYAEELYGWKEEEVLGKPVRDILRSRYSDTDYEKSFADFNKDGYWKGEVIHTHKDGNLIYVLSTVTALKAEAGAASGTVSVIRDITRRKKAEQQLQALKDNLETEVQHKVAELNNVFERITDAFIALDNNWNYIYINEKAAELHGLKPADLIGKNIWEMFPDVVNEDFYTALHKARETGEALRLELYYSRTKQWFEDLIYPSPEGISVYYHDITAKKNTELELQDAESKFRNLVEKSLVGVYILQNEKFVYANPFFADIFGYSPDHIIHKLQMDDLVSEKDKEAVREHIYSGLNKDLKTMNYEFEGVHKSGAIINVEVFGTQMLYKGETAIIGTIINISERKKAILRLRASEEDLRLSNERFMLVAKATNDAIWDWDLRTDLIQGNESFAKIYGIDPKNAVSYDSFISNIHPDDAGLVLENFSEALKNKKAYLSEEFRLRRADGTYCNMSDRAYILYNAAGEAYRMLGAMRDITIQKTGEQQLRIEKEISDSIINSLPGIFYLYNKEGRFYRWNKNFELVTGYSAEEIRHLHPLDLFPEDEKERLKTKINNVFLTGEDSVEARFLTKYRDEILFYFTGMLINYGDEVCLMGVGFDLSEKIRSEQQLVESEEKFRTLIEQASDGIFISNQIGDYLVVNSSAALLTGYTKEELLEMNMLDIIFEKNLAPSTVGIKELLSGQAVINEKLIRQKSGRMIHVEISSKLLPDGRFQGIVRDITARKWAEEGLRSSEEKRRLIMNASLDAIVCIDIEGMITFWNPQAEKVFGWKAEEVSGKKLSGIIIPEKFRAMHDSGIENYLETGQGKVFNRILELSAINRADEEFPVELTVLPIKQGNEEFFCAFIRDITSRKNAEEGIRISEHKYRLLFEQNPMPMWMISLPGKNFLAVNDAAVEFYGFTREEFLRMNLKDIRPEEEANNINNAISTYTAGISNTGIWQHRKKDGTIIMVNLITHDIIYQGKHAKLVLSNDMTEKIMAEEKLKNSHAELRELATHLQNIREAERTHMAREIHDELGQQLTGLKMDLSWINRRLVSADDEIKAKMTETLKLIDGTVKTVRRIATQLRPSILDDLGIVAAMEWQSDEFQKRSEIETVFTSNLANIHLSPDLATGFFRVYQESLTNVLRHSQATKVDAMLTLNDGLLILSITDNGVGFNAKGIENKKTLGLLGMKERTLIMGGSCEITSKPGKGTTVTIIAPIHDKV